MPGERGSHNTTQVEFTVASDFKKRCIKNETTPVSAGVERDH
jgi:hypothetical protein